MPMNENENRKNDRTEATEDIKPIVIGSDGSLEYILPARITMQTATCLS